METVFDLVVLGAGPGGYLAAERASHAGLKTLLIEKRHIGGVCLNEGCIPSKALLYSAKIYDQAVHAAKYAVKVTGAELDHAAAVTRKDDVVKTLVSGISSMLKKNGVTIIRAEGKITRRDQDGFEIEADGKKWKGKRLLIATGSAPLVPPIPGLADGLKNGFVATNREILSLAALPMSLVIIGGGVIGLEMACYFATAGTKVTVVEMLSKIAGPTEAELSTALQKSLAAKGVIFELNAKVTSLGVDSVTFEKSGKSTTLNADKVLLSIGRRPVSAGIGLENIGVALKGAAIPTDAQCRTNIPGVYAVGDVNGVSMLAHTAYREAEVAVNHMLGKTDSMRYDAIPAVIYTNPEVASVGETEDSAKAKGIDVQAAKATMNFSGRYVAENGLGDGFAKVVVDKKRQQIIGIHIFGSYASEMIYGAGLMVEAQMRVDDIKKLVFPHPTVCEVIREAIFML